MKEIEIISDVYAIKDTNGNTLLEIPIMELYYAIAYYVDEAKQTTSRIGKFKYAAEKINADYECTLSWAQVLDVFDKIDDIIIESKKNSTPTPE